MNKIPAIERKIEGFEKCKVPFGYRLGEFVGQPRSLKGVRINRWLEPVGHKSFEAAAESPCIQNRWLGQKAMNEGLVIASQKNRFFGPLVSEQKIQYFSRGWPPVNIVANKNHDRTTGCGQFAIHVDLAEQHYQKISAAVNISDRVNPEPIR
jgi:hypothetical protein